MKFVNGARIEMNDKTESNEDSIEPDDLASVAAHAALDAQFSHALLLSFVGHVTANLMDKGMIDAPMIAEKFKEVVDKLDMDKKPLSKGTAKMLTKIINGELKS